MEYALITGLTSIITYAICAYLARGASVKATPGNTNTYHLRMNKFFAGGAIVTFAIAFFFLILPLILPKADSSSYMMVAALVVFFGGFGIIFMLHYKNHQVWFNDETIEVRSIYGKSNTLKWAEVSSAILNLSTGKLVLTNQSGQKVKINQQIVGFSTIMEFLRSKTSLVVDVVKK